MNASADRAAFMQQEEAALLKRLARAVADIMEPGDEPRSIQKVAERRQVPESRLRKALNEAGWKSRIKAPGPRRRSFGGGGRHGTQLPRARSDNQS